MANFHTHILVAGAMSGIGCIGALTTGLALPSDVPTYFAMGLLGGILPDIDSDHSTPVSLFFSAAGLLCAFLAVFHWLSPLSIAELVLLWTGIYVLIRYALCQAFMRLTVHRGVFHSLLAATFFSITAATVLHYLFDRSPITAWFGGIFLGFGYVVHLTLDELYSVDILGTTIKRSFGSALKPFSLSQLKASILLALATGAVLTLSPDFAPFRDALLGIELHDQVTDRLWPHEGWFKDLIQPLS